MPSSTRINYLIFLLKPTFLLAMMIGVAIFWGVASFQHIGPGFFDIYINLQISCILSLAFILFFIFSRQTYKINISLLSLGWLYLLIIVALQPVLNIILYSDSLIFVLGELLIVLMLSIILANMADKIILLKLVTLAVFFSAIFTVFTLVIQTLELSGIYHWLVMPIKEGGRPIANVAQPNQAAFIIVLGVISLFYFRETTWLARYRLFSLILFFLFCVALALTSSRGGIILMVLAILTYTLLNPNKKSKKMCHILLLLALLVVGYLLGSQVLEFFREDAQTGIERFSSSLIKQRSSQFLQAMLIFADNWFTGAGWGNYASAGLAYTDKIDWVYFSNHSHLIFSHIMAELGLLGLVGTLFFVYVLGLKLWQFKHYQENKEYRLAMSICLIIVAYSFSEFPLWYLKYLLIFTVYVSFLDIPTKVTTFSLNKRVLLILPISLLIASVFYLFEYSKYTKAYDYFITSMDSGEEKFKLYKDLSIPYGFMFYNEAMIYYFFSLDERNLDYKLAVGERVTYKYPTPPFTMKHATFLALNKQVEKSLKFFQASCLYNYANDCDAVADHLDFLKTQSPEYFLDINSAFLDWRKAENIQ